MTLETGCRYSGRMEVPPPVRTGVFLVRAWVEDDSLRARITHRIEVTEQDETAVAVTGIEAIEASFHSWLQSFVAPVTPP